MQEAHNKQFVWVLVPALTPVYTLSLQVPTTCVSYATEMHTQDCNTGSWVQLLHHQAHMCKSHDRSLAYQEPEVQALLCSAQGGRLLFANRIHTSLLQVAKYFLDQ